jgi:hypothetical protein
MLGTVGGRTEASSSGADVEHKLESFGRARGHAHYKQVWSPVPGVVSWYHINYWVGALDRDVLLEDELVCERRSVGASLGSMRAITVVPYIYG